MNSDPELTDTATSPVKGQNMEVDKNDVINCQTKRPLEFGQVEENENEKAMDESEYPNETGDMTANGALPEKTETEQKKERTKRPKKDGADSPSLGLAGSLEGPVRLQ
jgi:hypothetical protein